MGPTVALTVTVVVVMPQGDEYVMTAVPIEAAVTTPVADATMATEVLLLLHVPPEIASVNPVVEPRQKLVTPVIGGGVLLTVTSRVATPQAVVYEMIAVPGEAPRIIPVVAPTDATVLLLLIHVPPATASERNIVVPRQMPVVPVIGDIPGLTLTVAVVKPQAVV